MHATRSHAERPSLYGGEHGGRLDQLGRTTAPTGPLHRPILIRWISSIFPTLLTRITYDLRRLRLHGPIERIPKTHRYRITAKGLRIAIFYTRLYNRSLRTGLAPDWR